MFDMYEAIEQVWNLFIIVGLAIAVLFIGLMIAGAVILILRLIKLR